MSDLQNRVNQSLSDAINLRRDKIKSSRRGLFKRNGFRRGRNSFRTEKKPPSFFTGSQVFVSNLEAHVTGPDLRNIFKRAGRIRDLKLHYNKSGNSLGTAEVVFMQRSDALKACKEYNKALVDGRPMKIEMLSAVSAIKPEIEKNGSRSLLRGRKVGFRNRSYGRSRRRSIRGEYVNPLLRQESDRIPRGQRSSFDSKNSFFGTSSSKMDVDDLKKVAASLDAELDMYNSK